MLPLVSAGGLADYITGPSLERVELDALVAADGKMIARRALFKEESPEALTDEYHAKYVAAGVTITTLEIEPVYAEYAEGKKNVETYDKAADVVTARPLVDVCSHLLLISLVLADLKQRFPVLVCSPNLPADLSPLQSPFPRSPSPRNRYVTASPCGFLLSAHQIDNLDGPCHQTRHYQERRSVGLWKVHRASNQ